MHVEVFNLAPTTEFAALLLQVPKNPFGLTWYQGDILTNAEGKGVGDFPGIFRKETFIQAPGIAPARPCSPTTLRSIRPPAPSRFITWESGSRTRPMQLRLIARRGTRILMATTRLGSRC